jgi:hypothetical protein
VSASSARAFPVILPSADPCARARLARALCRAHPCVFALPTLPVATQLTHSPASRLWGRRMCSRSVQARSTEVLHSGFCHQYTHIDTSGSMHASRTDCDQSGSGQCIAAAPASPLRRYARTHRSKALPHLPSPPRSRPRPRLLLVMPTVATARARATATAAPTVTGSGTRRARATATAGLVAAATAAATTAVGMTDRPAAVSRRLRPVARYLHPAAANTRPPATSTPATYTPDVYTQPPAPRQAVSAHTALTKSSRSPLTAFPHMSRLLLGSGRNTPQFPPKPSPTPSRKRCQALVRPVSNSTRCRSSLSRSSRGRNRKASVAVYCFVCGHARSVVSCHFAVA